MRTTKRYKVQAEKIHSMKDLQMEKQRLQLEIMKTENNIQADYHNLLHALTFKNIASNIISDISTTSSVVSKAISIGKTLFGKRKKKHREENWEG